MPSQLTSTFDLLGKGAGGVAIFAAGIVLGTRHLSFNQTILGEKYRLSADRLADYVDCGNAGRFKTSGRDCIGDLNSNHAIDFSHPLWCQ